MTGFQDIYDINEYQKGVDNLRYYFVSKGEKDIIKIVQYQHVKQFGGFPLFNFGFGDYDLETGNLSDKEMSNNKDHYKVFHTVLETVPRFFDIYGDVMLMVQGSDSSSEFIEHCKANCSRKCNDNDCKKSHRRINVYRGFLDKNFDILSEKYIFKGGKGMEDHNLIEDYRKGEKYNAIFVSKKS